MKKLDNTFTSNNNSMDGLYYRMYKTDKGSIAIVCMQWFDEYDYHEENFVRDINGNRYFWTDERDAKKQLLEWFKKKEVDEEHHDIYFDKDEKNTLTK